MAKFKVGDKVRVLDGSKIENYFGGWIMDEYVGSVQTIRNLIKKRDIVVYQLKNNRFYWDERGLELVNEGEPMVQIDRVIFNDPATIVKWKDGTKTVVKCQEDDLYDPEKGLALCIAKKALGNERDYYDVFKKWLPKDEPMSFQEFINAINNIFGIKPTEEPKEEPKPQKTVEEMRNVLDRFCGSNAVCVDCILNNHPCKCGKGYTFKSPRYDGGYIDDKVIADAYKVVIGEKPKPEPLYNGRVVCIDNNNLNLNMYTVGKIYEFKDGQMVNDQGVYFPRCTKIKTFDDWTKLSASKWLEIKE